jgi:hypothetical protein
MFIVYLLQLRVVHGLLFALGNANYPDSQRQAAITLEVSSKFIFLVLESVFGVPSFDIMSP